MHLEEIIGGLRLHARKSTREVDEKRLGNGK
jgi:hypothetical protein